MGSIKAILAAFPPEESISEAKAIVDAGQAALVARCQAVRSTCKHDTVIFCEQQPMSYFPYLKPIWRCTSCGLEREPVSAWHEHAPEPFSELARTFKVDRKDIYQHRRLFADEPPLPAPPQPGSTSTDAGGGGNG